jgi:hypothetical protein
MATRRNEVFARQPILAAMLESRYQSWQPSYPIFLRYS